MSASKGMFNRFDDVIVLDGMRTPMVDYLGAFDHRGGFRLGAPVGFEDDLWEALNDPAPVSMIQTAEYLARQYGSTRAEVDAFAAQSFARAVAVQEAGWFAGETVPVANEAQGAQTLAVAREIELDLARLNVKGGAIALGHPLAATGVRLTITVARQLKEIGARRGVASACIGGGQGIALLIENTEPGSSRSR